MKVYLAQINPTVGALHANVDRAIAAVERGRRAGADLVVLPEMTVTGYPPRDLLEKSAFVEANLRGAERLAGAAQGLAVVFGYAEPTGRDQGQPLYNTAALAADGQIRSRARKSLLPTYDVFDEDRYFEPAQAVQPVACSGRDLGLTICEDVWNDKAHWTHHRYPEDPVDRLCAAGIDVLVNISASPFQVGKIEARLDMLRHLARSRHRPVVYLNQVGGNDDILFDGHSVALDAQGRVLGACKGFDEDEALVDLDGPPPAQDPWPASSEIEQVLAALVLGTRDYAAKCGFHTAVLGLSGGIDSAVTACIAARALGAANVQGVALPSPYSSRGSIEDAAALARNLGMGFEVLPITRPMLAVTDELRAVLGPGPLGVTEENVQARLRGLLLMALSNHRGSLLLTTGNKSELAVGYCTLYGDMAGGLAVLSDCLKGRVYALARRINADEPVIPESTLDKPPSAELRPDQTDQDTLPPYELLDAVLEAYVERGMSLEAITASGYDPAVAAKILRMVDANEYKRKQAAPGLRITRKAFGTGRRMPIAQGWREEESEDHHG